jgi:hypothetical protein
MSLFWRTPVFLVRKNHIRLDARTLDDRSASDLSRNLFDHLAACPIHAFILPSPRRVSQNGADSLAMLASKPYAEN